MRHEFNQPSQHKASIEMGLYPQKHCQLELQETDKVGWNEDRLLDFLDSRELDHRALCQLISTLLQDKGRRTPNTIQRSSGLPLPPQAQSSWTCGLGVQNAFMLISRGEENAQQRICGIWPSPHRATGTWPLPGRASPTQPPPGRTVGLMTQWAQGAEFCPNKYRRRCIEKKEYYCPALRSSRACLARNLYLLRTLTPSTFSPIFPCGDGLYIHPYAICPCFTIVSWKHATCLGSRVHSWRILPQDDSYCKPHPYLI